MFTARITYLYMHYMWKEIREGEWALEVWAEKAREGPLRNTNETELRPHKRNRRY
jgi:hypothetical protein